MKKVLSVALASAMVLGMGANAFAISYSTGSNEKADWPEKFQFDGALFVTDKDGNIIKESTTELNDNENVDFQPGDVIWMPLFAKDQTVYDHEYKEGTESTDDKVVDAKATITVKDNGEIWQGKDGLWYNANGAYNIDQAKGYYRVDTGKKTDEDTVIYVLRSVTISPVDDSAKCYIAGTRYKTEEAFKEALAKQGNADDAYITVVKEGVDGTDESISKPIDTNEEKDYYNYTGNIDKNWSINLIEDAGYAEEIVEKAELYKATPVDVESYGAYAEDLVVNGVYVKVTLKKEWKLKDSVDMKYYVYVADNAGNKTNQVWVSGKYAPTTKTVDFQWTNDASEAAIWEAKESGTATFDFADKAFFTVKMYKGETMYLDLSTAYDKAIAGEMDAEADSFFKFDNENANFSRTGTLMIVSDDASLVPYEIDKDGNFVAVDAEYVENYAVAHTNKKVNGFVFNTKQLGNYVLSTEELGEEEEVVEEPTTEEPVVEEPTVEEPVVEETNKPNPNTGAEDFVGLAVSLAVVSVAAAGALALKK